MSETEKMLARREAGVGHLIFNNPERRNAVSLDMWEAATKILDEVDVAHRIGLLRPRCAGHAAGDACSQWEPCGKIHYAPEPGIMVLQDHQVVKFRYYPSLRAVRRFAVAVNSLP